MRRKRKKFLKQNFHDSFHNDKPVWLSKLLGFLLGIVFLVFLGVVFGRIALEKVYYYYSRNLPSAIISVEDYPEVTRIYDRTGKLLFEDIGEEDRIYITVEDVSVNFLKAILLAEDQNFFNHQGIDYWASFRAVWHNFQRGGLYEGASTISQQLARNFFLDKKISLSRKIKEAILAQRIERNHSKKEILEFYLNKIPFGSNIYGIEAASRAFFGKSARFLTLAEATVLAPIPRSPNELYPYSHPEAAFKKQKELLVSMQERGIISPQEYEKAVAEKLNFQKTERKILAPHFAFFVLDNLKKIYTEETREKGLEVVTTVDLNLQQKMDKLLKETIDKYKKHYHINNGAIVVLDAHKGDILAMSGSYDFWEESFGQYNGATALRQPGSTLKPLIYAFALQELGWSPATVLPDKPLNFGGYQPKNFSGYYRGSVSLRNALLNSLNIPAVYTLDRIGVANALEMFLNCHLALNEDAGLSMVVGGASASLLNISSAYTVFLNEGKYLPFNYLLLTKESNGKTLIANHNISAVQVFTKSATAQIDEILKKYLANFPLTRNLSYDPLLKDTRVKTGTSNGPRDIWSIGYNSDIIVGVWLGNHDNSLLRYDVYGLQAAVPLWADAMKLVLNTNISKPVINME
jgi:penicillin-binding protein 1C